MDDLVSISSKMLNVDLAVKMAMLYGDALLFSKPLARHVTYGHTTSPNELKFHIQKPPSLFPLLLPQV